MAQLTKLLSSNLDELVDIEDSAKVSEVILAFHVAWYKNSKRKEMSR